MYCQGILQQKNDCKHPTLEFQIAFMCHNHKLRNKRPLVGALEQASFAHIFQYPNFDAAWKLVLILPLHLHQRSLHSHNILHDWIENCHQIA